MYISIKYINIYVHMNNINKKQQMIHISASNGIAF